MLLSNQLTIAKLYNKRKSFLAVNSLRQILLKVIVFRRILAGGCKCDKPGKYVRSLDIYAIHYDKGNKTSKIVFKTYPTSSLSNG